MVTGSKRAIVFATFAKASGLLDPVAPDGVLNRPFDKHSLVCGPFGRHSESHKIPLYSVRSGFYRGTSLCPLLCTHINGWRQSCQDGAAAGITASIAI
jgi:hypothetical protein